MKNNWEVIEYRNFLWKDPYYKDYRVLAISKDEFEKYPVDKWEGFIKWLDEDWNNVVY